MDGAHTEGTKPEPPQDGASVRSAGSASIRSSRSSVSAAAAHARARAEAARARAAFTQREVNTKMEKARLEMEKAKLGAKAEVEKASLELDRAKLEADLEALNLEKEAAAAIAEAEVLEAAAAAEMGAEAQPSWKSLPVMVQSTHERVSDYIRDQTTQFDQHKDPVNFSISERPIAKSPSPSAKHIHKDDYVVINSWPTSLQPQGCYEVMHAHQTAYTSTPPAQPDVNGRPLVKSEGSQHESKRNTPHPKPELTSPQDPDISHIRPPEASVMMDMAKYLARKELVSTGLTHFDDHPESYRAWKSAFSNTIKGLDLTASEQLDLLSKWLGKESSTYVKRLRAVHIDYPNTALGMVWGRLDECYGAPEVIENALFRKLDNFPKITNKDNNRLRDLGDLLMELLSAKDDGYLPGLAYLDTARGIKPIVDKLPYNLQEKWITQGSKYKEDYKVGYPPFSFFTSFICYQAKTRNDPSFALSVSSPVTERPITRHSNLRNPVSVHTTNVVPNVQPRDPNLKEDISKHCPIHNKPHPLKKCRGFRLKTIEERRMYLKDQGICFKCCASTSHLARDCKAVLKCDECDSDKHITALHPGPRQSSTKIPNPPTDHGGEPNREDTITESVASPLCTEVCGNPAKSKSCAKICLVKVYPKESPQQAIKMYAMLDDQSNQSLAKTEFFDLFKIETSSYPYILKTCAGSAATSGRRANGYKIEAANGGVSLTLPTLFECNELPDNRDEIPTPEAVFHHPHLKSLASKITPLDNDAQILLLLGRDILRVHKVRQQINGPGNAPFAQRLDLGWVLVGDVCLGKVHKPVAYSYKTNILENGRPSLFRPCASHIHLKQIVDSSQVERLSHSCPSPTVDNDSLGITVFVRTADDDKRAFSIEDEQFLQIMDNEVFQDHSNSWVAPLPFRSPRPPLPNNREQAMTRLFSLLRTLERKPKMKDQFVAFLAKIFDNNHAEPAPPLPKGKECWYLPMFGVYHPRKPDQIRVVFDSSAQHNGISLNNVLLTGPDLNNSLMGVLVRFRRERVAIMADIEQMFHCFVVREDHRDYLRFLWYRDNDPSKDIVEYRMRVHVFGNSPSPAVATYCLRKAANEREQQYGTDTKQFVERQFYVDDGLLSTSTEEEAISLLKRTQASLSESKLRLHKITSNSVDVLKAFPAGDHAKGIKDLFSDENTVPTQRSLGLSWDVKSDTFTFQVSVSDKPFTRRGVLSIINSLFDPLGFVAPVTIQGKSLLRELTLDGTDWDSPLPQDKCMGWEKWKDSLQELQNLQIPRAYATTSCSNPSRKELCIFSDASTKAIGAVAYLKTTDANGHIHVGFILGKARLAPPTEPTIPRLELCAAVLAVEMAEFIAQEIDTQMDAATFYCDSKVVLGYIYNQSKRFYVYVHNRVQRIRQSTQPSQWRYVPTEHNPADHASRSVQASQLTRTNWFTGPAFLYKSQTATEQHEIYELLNPDSDVEIRPQVTTCVTSREDKLLSCERFTKFSTWKSIRRGVASLIHVIHSFKSTSRRTSKCNGWHWCPKPLTADELSKATTVILLAVQRASFAMELDTLSKGTDISKRSALTKLNPILDVDGLLKVGGRLALADLSIKERHPVILPGKHHVSTLLIRHYHEQVEHQGRTITEGAIRAAGIWLVGGKRRVSTVLHGCVTCRKLRGKREEQKMSNLPQERLSTSPPFTYTGVDVFGPWAVVARRTRGGMAQNKRWAVLFTCMSTRAVHIEVVESLDTSSFINSLRRFFAIRGPSEHLYSDCGTNFVGACKELEFQRIVSKAEVQRYTNNHGCTWHFNPPHSSHMGGVWERMIGVARRILDSMLMRTPSSSLTHEVLCTLMAEVTAIINSRPLVSVSSDPDTPQILTPATLLTQKQSVSPPPGTFTGKDLYKRQWRQVQSLADQFWSRWKREYLQTLQVRHKWQESHPNIERGDVVLMKDDSTCRNNWPMALVTDIFPGKDGKVRKIEIRVIKDGAAKVFLRPVTEVVMVLQNQD